MKRRPNLTDEQRERIVYLRETKGLSQGAIAADLGVSLGSVSWFCLTNFVERRGKTPRMGRTVPEWIADHPDQAIPARVKLRVWERCGGRCALTGRKLRPGDAYDFDHIKPLSIDGAGHRESNLQVVSRDAHKAKTTAEAPIRAKVNRIRKKHLGIKPAAGAKLKGGGFRGWRNMRGEIVWREPRS